jgi:hypothetical protein
MAGIGWAWLFRRLQSASTWISRLSLAGVGLVFLAGIFVNSGASQRHNTVFRDFVSTAFASLPPNAIVITIGDHLTGSVFYFHTVEKLRPDVIHLDEQLLGFRWYCDRMLARYPDLVIPTGVYMKGGFTIKQLMDANRSRPMVVLDRLETWDQSWKDGYKLATSGLTYPLVTPDRFPTFKQWAALNQQAMGSYDPRPALRFPEGSWERVLGELALNMQAARAHLALLYSSEMGNAAEPARWAIHQFEQVVRLAGGSRELGIPPEPGLRPLPIHPTLYKQLGICYETMSRIDPAFLPRTIKAWQLFVAQASADDTDLPATRAYLQRAGAMPR